MRKVVRIVMSCIFAGSYAVLCSALSVSAEVDSTLSPVTKKAVSIILFTWGVIKGIKKCTIFINAKKKWAEADRRELKVGFSARSSR